jgi:hypothetical protein
MVKKQNPEALDTVKKAGWTMRDLLNFYVYGGFGGAVAGVLSGVLAIVAGVRMLALKSYGLAVFSSVVLAIPCVSCSACCGLGEGIGIWALVVLMNEEVRAAFR